MKYAKSSDVKEKKSHSVEEMPLFTFRGRLSLMMAGVAIAVLAIVGVVMFMMNATIIYDVTTENSELITQNIAISIQSKFERWDRVLSAESIRIDLQHDDLPASMSAHFRRILADIGKDDTFRTIFFTSSEDGRVTSTGQSLTELASDPRNEVFYRAAVDSADTIVTSPQLDLDTHRPVFIISRAVRDEDKLIGVLAIELFADTFISSEHSDKMPEASYYFVIDAHDRVFAHPDAKSFGFVDDRLRTVTEAAVPNYDKVVAMIKAWHDPAGNRESPLTEFVDWDGETRRFFAHHSGTCPWHVVSAISRRSYSANIDKMLDSFIFIGFVSVIFAVVASYLASTAVSYTINGLIAGLFDEDNEDNK